MSSCDVIKAYREDGTPLRKTRQDLIDAIDFWVGVLPHGVAIDSSHYMFVDDMILLRQAIKDGDDLQ